MTTVGYRTGGAVQSARPTALHPFSGPHARTVRSVTMPVHTPCSTSRLSTLTTAHHHHQPIPPTQPLSVLHPCSTTSPSLISHPSLSPDAVDQPRSPRPKAAVISIKKSHTSFFENFLSPRDLSASASRGTTQTRCTSVFVSSVLPLASQTYALSANPTFQTLSKIERNVRVTEIAGHQPPCKNPKKAMLPR